MKVGELSRLLAGANPDDDVFLCASLRTVDHVEVVRDVRPPCWPYVIIHDCDSAT